MRVIDEVHLEMPYAGACKIRAELRRRVVGLMKKMSVRPERTKSNLSKPAKRASTTCSRTWTARPLDRQRDRERRFRSLKSECMRICEYGTPAELRRLVADYVEQHNAARPHQSLDCETPSGWYYSGLPPPRQRRYRTRTHFRPKISCSNRRPTLT